MEDQESKEYARFDDMFDRVLRDFLTNHYYKKAYSEGWYISELVKRNDGNWLVIWGRRL